MISVRGSTQSCEFEYRISQNALPHKVEIIDSVEYSKFLSNDFVKLNPKNEAFFIENYSSIFQKINGCYEFKSQTETIKICELNQSLDSREQTSYKIIGLVCNNAVIYTYGYESFGYVTVNLANGLANYTLGLPEFANCAKSVSHANYYGEEEIILTAYDSIKRFEVISENWTTAHIKMTEQEVVIQLESLNTCSNKYKYLKICQE